MTAFLKTMLFSLLLAPFVLVADFGRTIKILPNGTINIDGRYRAIITRFDPDWKPISQHKMEPDAGFPQSSAKNFELHGKFDLFRMTENVKATAQSKFHYEAELFAIKGAVPCNLLF